MMKYTLFASKQRLESQVNNRGHVGDPFDHKGIVHQESVCAIQSANQYHCQETVQHLKKQAHCQCLEQWPNQTH
jgi:hypothetical protein